MPIIGFSTRGRGDHSSLKLPLLPQLNTINSHQTTLTRAVMEPPPLPILSTPVIKICDKRALTKQK